MPAKPLIIASLTALAVSSQLAGGLVAMAAISNDALAGAELPTRLKLLNWGDNNTIDHGSVKVGANTAAALAANQAKFGFDRIALDFAHNSLETHPNYQRDPREVAAYGVPKVVVGDGLYLEQITYTPAGRKFAANYSDLSPTPRLDAAGEVDFIHSVALCPQGNVVGLTFLSADILRPLSTPAPKMDFKALLLTILGLAATASDEDVMAGAKAFAEKEKKPEETKPPTEEVKAMMIRLSGMEATLKALTTSMEIQHRATVLSGAVRDGKVVPLSAQSLPLVNLIALVAELPANQVPLDQRTPENLKSLSTGVGVQSAADEQVRNLLGISKEAWDKSAA